MILRHRFFKLNILSSISETLIVVFLTNWTLNDHCSHMVGFLTTASAFAALIFAVLIEIKRKPINGVLEKYMKDSRYPKSIVISKIYLQQMKPKWKDDFQLMLQLLEDNTGWDTQEGIPYHRIGKETLYKEENK